jgi:multidrug efflux system outer membrane protein
MEYLPKRPDIINQRQTIERLELTRNMTTHTNRSPTLELGTQWRGAPGSGGLNGPFTDSVGGSVTLRLPIDSWIPGTRKGQEIRAANAEVEKARLDLQNTETSAKTQIRSLISRLHRTWERLEITRLEVEIAQRTTEAAEDGFRNGTIEFQDLEDTRNKLTDARQRLIQGEYDYQSLFLDLAAAINVEWKILIRQ